MDPSADSQQLASYEDQNKMLRELYQQRIRARAEQNKQQHGEQHYEIRPQIKLEPSPQENPIQYPPAAESTGMPLRNLLLNTLFYDSREDKPSHMVKIFSFFNEDVHKPTKKVSDDVQSIFITTYGFEMETFDHLLSLTRAKLVIYNDSKQVGANKIISKYDGRDNMTVILAGKSNASRYGLFHTKLWLIKFKGFLRVVIGTGNQHVADWAVWCNAYWYQDFPLSKQAPSESPQEEQNSQNGGFDYNTDFKNTLVDVIDNMLPLKQLEELTTINLDSFQFSGIKVILIPSVAGRHYGESMKKQGICKLKQVMKKLNKIKDPVITCQSSSLGVVESEFVNELCTALCPHREVLKQPNFRLIYPTQKYIQEETGGQAQVLFLTKQNYEKSDMKSAFYKFDTNPFNPILGCIPHLKTIVIEESQEQNKQCILYVGSHNTTKAAWGRLEKQGSQLYIANSELGMLFMDVESNWFRRWVPFKYPPDKYGPNDTPFIREFLP